VIEIDGHNIEEIADALESAKGIHDMPTLIIAHTIPGKGVPEIENDYRWHGKPPTPEEEKRFLQELRTLQGKVHKEYA
jgi:transketolase